MSARVALEPGGRTDQHTGAPPQRRNARLRLPDVEAFANRVLRQGALDNGTGDKVDAAHVDAVQNVGRLMWWERRGEREAKVRRRKKRMGNATH